MTLEALISHLYVVGGRSVAAKPPGALESLAPKRSPRPRHNETFFALVTPSGDVKAQAATYTAIAQHAADRYFKMTAGITSGLRDTVVALNQFVIAEGGKLAQPLRANVICAVIDDHDVYLARCGAMMGVYANGQQVVSFPTHRDTESLNLTKPLGASSEPRIELAHYELAANAFLVLADASYAPADNSAWQTALDAGNLNDVLQPVRALADPRLSHATVVQFVTEDTPTPDAAPIKSQVAPSSTQPDAAPATDSPPEPDESELASTDEKTDAKRRTGTLKTVAKTLATVADQTQTVSEKMSQEVDEEGRNPLLSNLVVLLAFIIPLIVVIVVVGLALSQEDDTAYEVCRSEVIQLRDAALVINPPLDAPFEEETVARARQQWEVVQAEALLCEDERPNDVEMLTIAGEAQNNLDRFDRVIRRDVSRLRSFGENVDLRGPVSGNWITMYTLDRRNDEMFQDVLSTSGNSLIEVSDVPIVFIGQSIRGEIVDELVDVFWMERGGLPVGGSNVPVVLDETGLLVWYNETFDEYDLLRLITPPTWNAPTAVATWRLNMYVLDRGAQQIWRYVPNNGIYSQLPEEYFAGEERPDLSNAVDFGIDEDGSIFVLFSDGVLRKYIGGEEQPFDVFNLPAGALQNTESLFVDNNPISRGLVVTDSGTETLYTLSLGGTINQGYRPLNDLDAFDGISGALVNAEFDNIYVLAGNSLYHMNR